MANVLNIFVRLTNSIYVSKMTYSRRILGGGDERFYFHINYSIIHLQMFDFHVFLHKTNDITKLPEQNINIKKETNFRTLH